MITLSVVGRGLFAGNLSKAALAAALARPAFAFERREVAREERTPYIYIIYLYMEINYSLVLYPS